MQKKSTPKKAAAKRARKTKPQSPAMDPTKPDGRTKRELRYYLTRDEQIEVGKKHAEATVELRTLEADKKRSNQDYAARIAAVDASQERLAEVVTTGYELREITCGVYLDNPEKGRKTIKRLDTFETVAVEEMTSVDMQRTMRAIDEETDPNKPGDPGDPGQDPQTQD